jgi:hypothetical protein
MRRLEVICGVVLVGLAAFAVASIAFPDFLFAGGTRAAPAPLIGLGLPIAGAVVATVLVARRFRRKQ